MSISAPFIRRPIGTALLAIGLALAGIVAYFALPVAPLPQRRFPDHRGLRQPARRRPGHHVVLRRGAAGAASRRDRRRDGDDFVDLGLGSTFIVQFDLSRRLDDAARGRAGGDQRGRPRPATGPALAARHFRKVNPADAPVLILALTSDTVAPGAVYDAARQHRWRRASPRCRASRRSTSPGAEQPAIRVAVDPAAAAAAGVSLGDIRAAIGAANVTQPTGLIDGADQAATISGERPADTARTTSPSSWSRRRAARSCAFRTSRAWRWRRATGARPAATTAAPRCC